MPALDRTWHLYKESFAVLSGDREILIFPILSGACAILLAAAFFIPLYRGGTLLPLCRGAGTWESYATLFAWYCLNQFLIVFFNAALIACAGIRLSGGRPTVAAGVRAALGRVGRIAAWAFIAATVGMVLHSLNNRRGLVSRLFGAALSLGWTMVTYLIVPVLVMEDCSVFDAIHRSKELFRKQWGEELIGSFGFGLLNALLLLPGLFLAFLLWPLDPAGAIIVGITYALFLTVIGAAVTGVFKAALYLYAATGAVPPGFTSDALNPTRRTWSPGFDGSVA